MSEPAERVPPRPPLNSVSAKIIAFVFCSTFLTALVVSWISIQSTHGHLRRQIDERFPLLLRYADGGVAGWIALGTRQLEALSGAPLEPWLSGQAFFDAAIRLNADGRPVESAGADAEWLVGLARAAGPVDAPTVRLLPVDETRAVAVAARPEGSGAIVAVLNAEPLHAVLAFAAASVEADLHLTDADGRVIASAGGGEADVPGHGPPRTLVGLAPGVVHEMTGSDGEHVLASAVPVESLGGWLSIDEPFEVAFRPVLEVVTRIFLCDLAIILLASLLAYRVTTRLMQPIEALSEGARRISQGQIDHEIPDPKSADEIGLLTRTFNDMMRALRRNQLEIQEANARLTTQYDELLTANEILAQLSITDGLTKLHNHRYFQDHLTREIKRVDRSREPLSMLLLDLDDFKQFNDRMGHAAGDELLVKIAQVMSESIRESDLLARYGGEEFVVLAPGTDLQGAVALAEKIRMAVGDSPHILGDSLRPVRVTLSVGVAQFRGDRKAFFRAADRALYRAKAEGKNCVIAAGDPDEIPV